MRKLAVLLLSVLVLGLGSVSLAQDTSTIRCGNLASADCTLLTDLAAAMKTLKSATLEVNLQIGLKSVPDSPDMAIGLTGNVDYAADPAALDSLMSSVTNPQDLAQALPAAIKAISTESEPEPQPSA